jgi:hypothetical protein
MEQIGKAFQITVTKPPVQPWLYCDGEDLQDVAHGCFIVALMSPLSNVTGEMAVTVHLVWSILVDGPDVPTLTTAAEGEDVYAGSGFESYFTDSTNDWAEGEKLTLKHTVGGQVVPFIGLKHGVVYRLDLVAKLVYWFTDVVEREIRFGVAIQGSKLANGMAVFESLTAAERYAKTGDTTFCLSFFKAGSKGIEPSNPAWKPYKTVSLGGAEHQLTQFDARMTRVEQLLEKLAAGNSERPD